MTNTSQKLLIQHGEAIIAAAITREMLRRGATSGDSTSGFIFGRVFGNEPDVRRFVSAPEGHAGGGRVTDANGRPAKLTGLDPLHDVYIPVRLRVQAAFRCWFDLASPTGFGRSATRMAECIHLLSYSAALDGGTWSGANDVLRDNMEYVVQGISPYTGGAVNAFKKNYLNPFDNILEGQRALALALYVALKCEQDLWNRATRDVVEIARKVRVSMEDMSQGMTDPTGMVFAIAASFGDIASVFAGPEGKLVSAAFKIASRFVPPAEPQPIRPEFGGTTAGEIIGKLEEGLHQLSLGIRTREQSIFDHLGAARSALAQNRSDYDLKAPMGFLKSSSLTSLGVVADKHELKVDPTEMRTCARMLPAVGKQFLEASHAARAAIDEEAWRRNGRVGRGEVGAYSAWRALNDELREILDDTKWEVVRAGEHLEYAARVIDHADSTVEAELRHHANTIHRSGASTHDYATDPA